MKSATVPALVVAALALAGAMLWTEGQTERRLTEAHRQLALLRFASATTTSDEVGDQNSLARVRGLAGDAATDARQVRTTAQYWEANYGALMPQRDAVGTITETNPAVLLIDANASFRASQAETDRNGALRKLDVAVKNYTEVLKANPNHPDAAYNFEYAVRTRDNFQRARQGSVTRQAPAPRAGAEAGPDDLPAGPTLHGHPGGPPAKTDMSQFKIVIPKRGEERKDDPQAGKGGVKVRKG